VLGSGNFQGMSALGQKRTCAVQKGMSALPPKATLNAFIRMSAMGQKRTSSLIPFWDPIGFVTAVACISNSPKLLPQGVSVRWAGR
jgi:hypothetical protein